MLEASSRFMMLDVLNFFVFNFLLSDFCVKYRMLVVLIGSNSEKEPRNVLQYQEKSSRWVFYGLKISIFLAETQ